MTARQARLRSLAKINLDLRVLGRRPDGFHEIRSVFQTISLGDTIDVQYVPGRKTRVELGGADIPNNLVVRAAEMLVEKAGIRGVITFALRKRIPMGAGLGGGSSNAAAVLLSLPVLAGKRIPMERLVEWATELGSDVPFFLFGGACLGIGRGTELFPLPEVRSAGLLITPEVHVSTPEAYRALERPLLGESLTTRLQGPDTGSSWRLCWALDAARSEAGWKTLAANDFETAVFPQFPELAAWKRKLARLGACPAMMTGSGSAIFGLFDTAGQARAAREALQRAARLISLVDRRRYRAMWRRQLQEHSLLDASWPPRTRYE